MKQLCLMFFFSFFFFVSQCSFILMQYIFYIYTPFLILQLLGNQKFFGYKNAHFHVTVKTLATLKIAFIRSPCSDLLQRGKLAVRVKCTADTTLSLLCNSFTFLRSNEVSSPIKASIQGARGGACVLLLWA